MTSQEANRRRGRLMLIGLAALFFGPLLFSWAYKQLGFDWYPAPKLSGVLIEPPVELPLAGVAAWPTARWTLVVTGPCDAACWKTLTDLRQIVRSLPRYQDAMARVYLHGAGAALSAAQLREQDGLVPIEDADARLLKALQQAAAPDDTAFVMVDPHGFAMLRYRKDYDARAARGDIEHLLRRFVPN
jgi:hypothetical protein